MCTSRTFTPQETGGMMTDLTENYQRQMQEQYEATAKYHSDKSEAKMRRESYPADAAAEFKSEN